MQGDPALGIGVAQEVAVGIKAVGGDATDGIGLFGDAVQAIEFIAGEVTKRVGAGDHSARRIGELTVGVAGLKRHLRKIHVDPMTGRQEWGLYVDPTGAIIGFYSLAAGVPLKRTGFELTQAHFENAATYASWVFGLPNAGIKIVANKDIGQAIP